MKKIFIIVLMFVLSSSFSLVEINANTMNQNSYGKEKVAYIIENNIKNYFKLDEINTSSLKISKEFIYNINLDIIGYSYYFSYEYNILDFYGYLITTFTNTNGQRDEIVEEFSIMTDYPYNIKDYKNIYLGYNSFFEYDGNYLIDDEEKYIYNEILELFGNEDYVCGASGCNSTSSDLETIYYDFYNQNISVVFGNPQDEIGLLDVFPYLNATRDSHENNCSNIAGVELLMYWDFGYPNIISDYTPFNVNSEGQVIFKNWSIIETDSIDFSILTNLIDDFYIEMDTNNWGLNYPGTNNPNFYSAIVDYVDENVGYGNVYNTNIIGSPSTSFFSTPTVTSLSENNRWNLFKFEIDNGHPVVVQMGLSLNTFDYEYIVAPVSYIGTQDQFNVTEDQAQFIYTFYETCAHTVIAYGYMEYEFFEYLPGTYIVDGYSQEDFLVVANGNGSIGFINRNSEYMPIIYSLYYNY